MISSSFEYQVSSISMSTIDPSRPAGLEHTPDRLESRSQHKEKTSSSNTPKGPRQKRPNYHEIHAKPLPVDVNPLPVFIPHNPISYVKIAVTLLSHFIWAPSSHKCIHKAYFSSETQSIHVTDPSSVRALWEHGFFGKGSLSRSEPQWFEAEKRRLGVEASKTSAEVTQSRREERKQFKLERAKAQREAIEQQLRDEGKLDADQSLEELVDDGQMDESPKGTIYTPEAGEVVTLHGDSILSAVNESLTNQIPKWTADASRGNDVPLSELRDLEHLQLTPEEAFFLTYVFGVLDIVKVTDLDAANTDQPYPVWFLMRLYCAHALYPIIEEQTSRLLEALEPNKSAKHVCSTLSGIPSIEPDNPFILRYVVYHHFRSLGWVVRPGIKFAVDYLLYLRGPAFTHAEFAIMIIPSFSHSYWKSHSDMKAKEDQYKDWWWLHRVNRVQTQVMKTLLLVYVEIPPHWDDSFAKGDIKLDIGAVLKKYTIREFVVKRWSPSRNRD